MNDNYNTFNSMETASAQAEVFTFQPPGGVAEYHVTVRVTDTRLPFADQAQAVLSAFYTLLDGRLKGAVPVFARCFLSDAANQADPLLGLMPDAIDFPLSIVEQAPLDGTKIALWTWLQTDVQSQVLHNGLVEVKHGAYRHLWGASACNRAANSEYQTRLLLNDYVMQLMEQGCKLADNCVRTWFFVQNVDVNYGGVVKARNEVRRQLRARRVCGLRRPSPRLHIRDGQHQQQGRNHVSARHPPADRPHVGECGGPPDRGGMHLRRRGPDDCLPARRGGP